MGSLKQAAAHAEKVKTGKLARASLVLPLPLYGGLFAGRFGVVDADRLAEVESAGERGLSPDETAEVTAEFIGDACRHLLSRESHSSKPEKLTHDDGRPVRFDEELAEELGLQLADGRTPTSMADVVLAVWTVEDPEDPDSRMVNAQALNGFGLKLLNWMQNTSRPVEDELLGGSAGGPQ